MYLLDTNICIALNQEHPAVLAQFEDKGAECYIPTLVLAELYKGVYCSKRVAQNLAKLGNLLSVLAIVPFDDVAAEDFGKIQGELKRIPHAPGVFQSCARGSPGFVPAGRSRSPARRERAIAGSVPNLEGSSRRSPQAHG